MYYKVDGIPLEWTDQIVKRDEIDERINNLYTYCANSCDRCELVLLRESIFCIIRVTVNTKYTAEVTVYFY